MRRVSIAWEMSGSTRSASWCTGVVVAILCGVFSSITTAAPVHPFLDGQSLGGFNHACGVAVDSQGDLYVANAGASKIEIFDPDHVQLGTISGANEPCGLAVDPHGTLFVSEQGSGEVVRYVPSKYPFAGTPPSYDSPEAIDVAAGSRRAIVRAFLRARKRVCGKSTSCYLQAISVVTLIQLNEI
jgi:DNA-binding beta-propeller fold protein YncE